MTKNDSKALEFFQMRGNVMYVLLQAHITTMSIIDSLLLSSNCLNPKVICQFSK
jgi:hypothetical protein